MSQMISIPLRMTMMTNLFNKVLASAVILTITPIVWCIDRWNRAFERGEA
jgi:hypothetical protein